MSSFHRLLVSAVIMTITRADTGKITVITIIVIWMAPVQLDLFPVKVEIELYLIFWLDDPRFLKRLITHEFYWESYSSRSVDSIVKYNFSAFLITWKRNPISALFFFRFLPFKIYKVY